MTDERYVNNSLYSWGRNDLGQLGRARGPFSLLPEKVLFDPTEDLGVDKIQDISVGLKTVLLLTKDGKVYSTGYRPEIHVCDTQFTLLEALKEYKVTQVTAGWDSHYVLTDSGEVLGWGSNTYGQLGLDPREVVSVLTPTPMMSGCVQVDAGERHCVILTNERTVFTCGDKKKGQLGRDGPSFTLGMVDSLTNVRVIAAGQHHTMALTRLRKLYCWGWNAYNQCGPSDSFERNKCVLVPHEMTPAILIQKKSKIFCGGRCSGVLYPNGALHVWGSNRILGGEQGKNIATPKTLLSIPPVRHVCFGTHHVVVLLETGMVLSWGENLFGACGHGHTRPITYPVTFCVALKPVANRIFAGGMQCFALTE